MQSGWPAKCLKVFFSRRYLCRTLEPTKQEDVVACLHGKRVNDIRDLLVGVPVLPSDDGFRKCGGKGGKSANGTEEKHSGYTLPCKRTIRTFVRSVLLLSVL